MIDIDEERVLDLELRDLLESLKKETRVRAPGRKKRMIGLDDKITVTVITDPESDVQIFEELPLKEELEISGTNGVFVVTLTVKALSDLEKIEKIKTVQSSAEVFLPRLYHARKLAKLENPPPIPRHAPSTTSFKPIETGRNVIIATIDSGLDWTHGDFRKDDGKTRVEYYAWWGDEEDDSDSRVRRRFGFKSGAYTEYVSTLNRIATQPFFREADFDTKRREPQYVYKAEDINQALNGSRYIPHRDPKGHGTHCMSIAAGNGRASKGRQYHGVAHEATIMALGATRYPPRVVTWGIKKFFEEAKKKGLPAVISLSIGHHFGSHDGQSVVEKVIREQSGEGRIVVVAAGNEAEDGIHWQGEVSNDEEAVIPVRIADDTYQWVEVWIPKNDKVEAWVETPDGVQYRHSLKDPMKTVFGEFKLNQSMQNSNRRVLLRIYNGRLNHTWRIRIRVRENCSIEDGLIHAWGGTDEPQTSYHLFPGTLAKDCTVCIPATVEEAIVVGSIVSHPNVVDERKGIKNTLKNFQCSPFSSYGPTRKTKKLKGLPKPDIVAPGEYIIAALASDSEMATADRYLPRHKKNEPYLKLQGTSMAASFVAGVVALMLERCNNLTPEEVRELLIKSAKAPKGLKKKWRPEFGNGLLDTKKLFKTLECR